MCQKSRLSRKKSTRKKLANTPEPDPMDLNLEDSEKQEESNRRLKKIGSKLLDKVSFDVNTKGHIKRQKKPDESGQDIFKSPFLSIENVPYDMIRLPEKGIKVGATWTSVLEKTIKLAYHGTDMRFSFFLSRRSVVADI